LGANLDHVSDPLGVLGVVLADKFRVERLLGQGGFGVVYAGTHLVLGAPIAVKFMKPEVLGTDRSRIADEYLREARILFSLSHPAIIRMYDVGVLEHGGLRVPWVVLEMLNGHTLDQEIIRLRAERRMPSAGALREVFAPVLDALAFAHRRGVMHRDVKPSNIMLARATDTGALEPKVLDFGTARSQLAAFQATAGSTGFTPLYGAPEQWDPTISPPLPATDVYALGLTMLEFATLVPPHAGAESLTAILRGVMSGTGRPRLGDVRGDLPALAPVIERALAVRPELRFRDAAELRDAALAALAPRAGVEVHRPPWSPNAMTGPGLSPLAGTTPPAYAPPAYANLATVPNALRTTSPVGTTAARVPAASSRRRFAAMAIALVCLVVVVATAVTLATLLVFRGSDGSVAAAPRGAPAATAAPFAVAGGKPISPPNVRESEEFDRADAVAVAQKNHPSIEACAAKSRRFGGKIALVITVSCRDGRVTGTDCQTVWPSRDPRKLDPDAADFCACAQAATASWRFKPPKADVPLAIVDDTQWLRVEYVSGGR